MIIELKVEVQWRGDGREKGFVIPRGTRINTIEWDYLPDDTKEKMRGVRSEEHFRTKVFIIYYRGQFLTVNREDAHVPTTEKGWMNF